jgi:uncharacterized protein (DUF2141 family)
VSRALLGVLLTTLLPAAIVAQQRDTQPPASAAVATAEISGTVFSAENNAEPLRRVVVTVTGSGLNPRSVLTDDAGQFTFTRLPAGTFAVTARKAAYLAAPYGAKRPGRTGMPVALANAQRVNISIAMFRGAAITGVLRDAAGMPVRSVDVRAIDARTLLTLSDTSPPDLATTDDRGVFRIFGLLPGDYFIVALPTPLGSGEIVAPSPTSIDASLQALAARRASGPGTLTTQAPPIPPHQPIGFSPVYFPGTPDAGRASRVHVDTGEERAGVDFELRPVPMAAIEGVVRGDVPNLAAVQVTITPSGPRVTTTMSSNSLSGRPIDAQGTFRYSNLPPGSYRLVARARLGGAGTPTVPAAANQVVGARGGGAPAAPTAAPAATGDFLYGAADVELRGEDVSGVNLTLQLGGTISGRIVFAGSTTTPRPEDLTKMRPSLSIENATGMVNANGLTMGNSIVSNPPAVVKADGTFEIRGIGPGRFTFNTVFNSTADAGNWKLRSAMGGDRNLLDDVLDLGPGVDIRNVVVTFSDARTEISGTLQSGAGEVTTEYYIVALPADRAQWRPKSRRILSTRPATDGRFVFADLPAGEYIIAALTDLDPIDLMDPTFLEQIAPTGAKVTVVEGEKTIQNLKIR